jgi:hypothetical protein
LVARDEKKRTKEGEEKRTKGEKRTRDQGAVGEGGRWEW